MSSDDDIEGDDGVRAETPDDSAADESETLDTDEGESGTPKELIEIEDSDHLKEVVFGYDIVLANCYAEWCEHCQSMLPVVEELAAEHDIVVANVDVEQNRPVASRLVDDLLPRFVLFVDQQQMARLEGEQDKETFEQLLGRVDEFRDRL